jgi:hypothetical protein
MRILLPLGALTLVVLFVIGVVAPRRSHRVERWIDERVERAEASSAHRAGRLGDWTAKSLDLFRRAGDKALEVGRRLRRTAT